MEWRIRESGHGGFVAECGIAHPGGVRVGAVGSTMPAMSCSGIGISANCKNARTSHVRVKGVIYE